MTLTPYDKTKREPPSHYLRRRKNPNSVPKYNNWEYSTWVDWDKVTSFADAESTINAWNTQESLRTTGALWEYKLPLHCGRCYSVLFRNDGYVTCNETHSGASSGGLQLCSKCVAVYPTVKLPKPFLLPKAETSMPKPKIRNVGEIWRLDKANAPFGVSQWGYMGAAKTPYVITLYPTTKWEAGKTTPDGWACSCMNYTRNMPRTPCKHILNVMLREGVRVNKTAAKMANVDADKLEAFEKWQREQAEKAPVETTAGVKLARYGATGRKFR